MSKKLISVVIPAYNEEECVDKLAEELKKFFAIYENKYDFEAIIVENGSLDNTYAKLLKIHSADDRFKIVKLTRNCRGDGGITAGMNYAKGDAMVIMYADLEDPIENVAKFIEKWEQGYKNIYGIVKKRHCGFLRKMNSEIFYFIINKLTKNIIPRYVADFRLVDKQVYREINQFPEKNRFLRGLFAWSGFKSIGIEYERATRFGGTSKASTIAVLALALRGIFSFSHFPLRLSTILGAITSTLSFVGIFYFIIQYIFFKYPFQGFGTIVCLMLLLFGILFLLIGILGEYMGLVYEEVKSRPVYIVDELVGIKA